MSEIVLIRHAKTTPDPSNSAKDWSLAVGAEEACRELAGRLEPTQLTKLISSIEPKAHNTAKLLGTHLDCPVSQAENLHEQDRSGAPFLSEIAFQNNMRQNFEHPNELIWGKETTAEALSRFTTTLKQLVDANPNEKLGIVTHGTVISLLVAKYNFIDGYDFWQKLQMPDMVRLSLPYYQLSASEQMFTAA